MGKVAPNPMVGAVLVHEERVIGEGFHAFYGGPHAEAACLTSVTEEDRALIPASVLYVSLEPCAHFGKTPPCTDLIIRNRIPKVIVAARDPFEQVNGKGIEKLRQAGIEVITGILEKESRELNRRFFLFHTLHRPYVVLKWAQSSDGKLASENGIRLHISNDYSNRLVHKWRSEEMSILVGTNTALFDDPELTTRLWPGPNPVRLVIDMNLKLPAGLKLFNGSPTIIFNLHKHSLPFEKVNLSYNGISGVQYYQVAEDAHLVPQILNALYRLGLASVLVEGGSRILQSFLDENSWDEMRIITNEDLVIGEGLPAPLWQKGTLLAEQKVFSDNIRIYQNEKAD
jgi:diaminohydroxyphosphoribosylaminopyrimidine deaminase/5-amino-6-(5-phosphoribosylamino)uracil reductase